jgi:hypothetical protein
MANDINIVISADSRAATQNIQRAQSAVSNLDRRIKKSTQAVNRNAKAYNKNAVATNKWAKGALQQAGYQVGDFAVQVGGGTNALQALGQQGAQFAGVFGPIGAVVGAGIAIFAAFGVAIQKTAEAAEEASGKAKTFTDQINLLQAATSKLNDTQILSTGNLDAIREKYGALTADLREFLLIQRELALIETTKQLGLSFEKILNTQEYQTLLGELGDVKSDLIEAERALAVAIADKLEPDIIKNFADNANEMQMKFAAISQEVADLPEAKLLAFSDAFMEAADAKNIEGMTAAIIGVREQVTGLPLDARNALLPMIIQMEGQIRTLATSMGKSFEDVQKEVLSIVEAQYLLNTGVLPPQAAADLVKYKDLYKDIRKAIRSAKDEAVALGQTTLTNIEAQFMSNRGVLPPQAMEDFKTINKELEKFYDRLRARRRKESEDAESAADNAQNAARQRAEELAAINEKMLEPMRKLAELQRELAIREAGGGDLGVRMAKAADAAKSLAREQGMLDPTKLQEIAAAAADVERKIFFAENSISSLANRGAKALKNELDPAIQQIKSATEAIGSAFENSLMGVIDGTMNVKDAFKSMALSIINDLYRIFVVKQITGFISKAIGGMFGPIDTKIRPGVGNPDGIPDVFSGGGYTGNGARAGGLDGKGGRMAIIHPRETILDHTKGQGQGVTVVQNINVSAGVAQTVRAEMTTMLPQIGEYAKAAVLDARKRGGAYGGAFA